MAGSRAAHNSKLVQRHQRQQSNAQAKSSANKFTQKQSHFERRREEEQVRQQNGAGEAFGTTNRSVGDGLLSRGSFGGGGASTRATNSRYASHQDPEEEVRETPNPFAQPRRPAGASKTFTASTRNAMMGLDKATKSTRSTRRIDRFNLSSGAQGEGMGSDGGASASLMGVRRVRDGDAERSRDLLNENDGEQPTKLTRAEKFREMISSSKGQRAQLQRERVERDAATLQLDAEINGLLHLLPKRNKTEEEQEAFAQSGTPEVRALLASYRRGHEAKCLTLKSSGAFEVTTLAEAARAAAPQTSTAEQHGDDPTAPAAPAAAANEKASQFLDAADRVLLARIRSGGGLSTEEAEEKSAKGAASAGEGEAPRTRQVLADAAEARAARPVMAVAPSDDFDAMLQSFQMDPRRAHAVPRTLTEEEEVLQATQQQLLREDRQQLPSLGLQEKDQTQLTRGEWVAQGGDVAFQMDDADVDEKRRVRTGGEAEDNVDIPSSFEGDSELDDGDAVSTRTEDVEGLDEEDEEAAQLSTTAERVGGSLTLDRLLEQLERVATASEAAEARQQRLHQVLVDLHHYASRHVLEATKAFRLILVEAERSFLRGSRRGGIRQALLVYLYAITKVFPTSDYRHEVLTPFLLFVCSALMQMKLDSLETVHSYLVLTTLLLHCLKAGAGKFCAEVIVATVNVLALQLPRTALEPVRYQGGVLPTPLLERPEAPLLNSSEKTRGEESGEEGDEGDAATSAKRPPYQIGLFDTTHQPERLVLCAYRLLEELCDLYKTLPAFPVVLAKPFLLLDTLLLQPPTQTALRWTPTAVVRLAHETLAVRVRDTATAVEDHRTPLAMRTFRPRPIRLFDPLLAEREENAVKSEVRLMKRDIREDKKRLMRHLTAEATVSRRAQEKRHAVDEAQREKRYHNVMHQLQQQQHSMNTVESLKSRAKAAKKKGISGESNAKPVGDREEE